MVRRPRGRARAPPRPVDEHALRLEQLWVQNAPSHGLGEGKGAGKEGGRRNHPRQGEAEEGQRRCAQSGAGQRWQRWHRLTPPTPDPTGLGVTQADRNKVWLGASQSYADLLAELNKAHPSPSPTTDGSTEGPAAKRRRKGSKSRDKEGKKAGKKGKKGAAAKGRDNGTVGARVHRYHKLLTNKTVSNYSAEDLATILGAVPGGASFTPTPAPSPSVGPPAGSTPVESEVSEASADDEVVSAARTKKKKGKSKKKGKGKVAEDAADAVEQSTKRSAKEKKAKKKKDKKKGASKSEKGSAEKSRKRARS